MKHTLLNTLSLVVLTWIAIAASASTAETRCIPIVLLYDENEELAERRADTNRDCSHDELVFYERGHPVRSQRDRDHNGAFDSWTQYDNAGKVHLRELDTTGDEKVDRWIE